MSDKDVDMVNHPPHYKGVCACPNCGCQIEAIEITQNFSFTVGNSLKYSLRAGKKESSSLSQVEKTIQDYQKAIWYLTREIQNLQNGVYNGKD